MEIGLPKLDAFIVAALALVFPGGNDPPSPHAFPLLKIVRHSCTVFRLVDTILYYCVALCIQYIQYIMCKDITDSHALALSLTFTSCYDFLSKLGPSFVPLLACSC